MQSPRRVLFFQHLEVEHPGVFRDFLAADGHSSEIVEFDRGDKIPALDEFDALWVMGGPMDVWEESDYGWLRAEKAVIREAVLSRRLPYLGFCLRHQLLGDALGGHVGRAAESEVGIMPVTCSAAGRASPFLEAISLSLEVLQWHGAEIITPPMDAQILMSSACCTNQAMSVGSRAFSMQFHLEITAETVCDWCKIPAYADALTKILGEGGAERLKSQVADVLPQLNFYARKIYENWKKTTGFG